MKSKLSIVKIGGNIIDNKKELTLFLADFAQIKSPKILVHGGGTIANKLNDKLGIKTVMNEGRRTTSSANLEVVTMVYAGLINKKIVSKLQGFHCNALGLSGADANCLLATKRSTEPVDFGFVGDVKEVNIPFINMLLNNNIVPVFSAICHDGNGQLLNTNADTISSEIAIAMCKKYQTKLIYCFEKNGVLQDVNNEQSVIKTINTEKYQELKKQKIIDEGMLPKMENCFHALNNNVNQVIIGGTQTINSNEQNYTTLIL